jgi:hypothetical protein
MRGLFQPFRKCRILADLIPILAIVVLLKLAIHAKQWEYLDLNPLFSSLLAAAIFIFGFLISGILTDYKEGEKIPGDMAANMEAIFDEGYIIFKGKRSPAAEACMEYIVALNASIYNWFLKKERTRKVYDGISGLNDHFLALEALTDPGFINRLKGEQNALRKAVTRVHTIRETQFVSSAYAIGEALAFFLVLGLIFVKIEPFYESMFFMVLVTFLVVYMLLLLKDLDNPFVYTQDNLTGDQISLKPIIDTKDRLSARLLEVTKRS